MAHVYVIDSREDIWQNLYFPSALRAAHAVRMYYGSAFTRVKDVDKDGDALVVATIKVELPEQRPIIMGIRRLTAWTGFEVEKIADPLYRHNRSLRGMTP